MTLAFFHFVFHLCYILLSNRFFFIFSWFCIALKFNFFYVSCDHKILTTNCTPTTTMASLPVDALKSSPSRMHCHLDVRHRLLHVYPRNVNPVVWLMTFWVAVKMLRVSMVLVVSVLEQASICCWGKESADYSRHHRRRCQCE